MNRLWIAAVAAAFASAGMAGIGGAAGPVQPAQARVLADTVKPGQWEFTSQMQMPGGAQLPPGMQAPSGTSMQPGAGMKSTYRAGIDSETAGPGDPGGRATGRRRPPCPRTHHAQPDDASAGRHRPDDEHDPAHHRALPRSLRAIV